MSGAVVPVGPRIEVPFPVMTNTRFPWGLRCTVCHRPVTEGQPYAERLQSMWDNGDVMNLLTCVYCPDNETSST